jgi:hypothetical protein
LAADVKAAGMPELANRGQEQDVNHERTRV